MSRLTLPNDLVSASWLAENINHRELILLDASYFMAPSTEGLKRDGETEWLQETIPGALFFDFDKKVCDQNSELPHMMPSEALFQHEVQSLGINQDSALVVFDRLGIFSSPRVWWMFKSMGFHNVAVLDGGLNSWKVAGYPVIPGKPNDDLNTGDFVAQYQPAYFADKHAVLEVANNQQSQIVDARASNRFFAVVPEPRAGLRSGHMPTAKNLPFNDLLENGKMRDIEQLKPIYTSLIEENKNVIFSCGSGVTACILALGASLCGYHDLTVYDGSWTEWGADFDLPVVK
ncbi:3-mercaptopyruvate sulfurtransferase [Psychromonas sp. KJ10-10]|uniref:3-mercaptopyruvate sulfurtransferase n=1 Tax=Psychromonas sp. KJ10-10 TaxID=3391823 RepID=UPI0039B48BD7